jgi:hypothetical protein
MEAGLGEVDQLGVTHCGLDLIAVDPVEEGTGWVGAIRVLIT